MHEIVQYITKPKTCYCGLQKNLQICIDLTPSCVYSCKKKHMQEGVWSLHIISTITIIREVQVNLYLQGFNIGQQTAPLKHT